MSKLTIKIGSTISGLKAGLSKGYGKVKKFVSNVRGAFGGLAGTFGAVLSVAGINRAVNALDDIGKSAGKIGVSTEAMQKYNYAAKITGTTGETVKTSFKRMTSTILDAENGLTEAKRALNDLGLSWQKLAGLKPEKQFEMIVAALNNVDDASRRNALAQDVFGRGGQELQIFIRDFKELSGEIDSMGAIIPEDQIRNAEKLNDLITRIKTNWAAAIAKGVEAFTDITNGDPLGERRLRVQKQNQIRGMAKEAAGMGKAGLSQGLFQVADEIGSASNGAEMKKAVDKYRKLKDQLEYERKQKRQWDVRMKRAAAADSKEEKEIQKQKQTEEKQNEKVQDYIASVEKKIQLQKLVLAGKQKEAAIEKALADAKRQAGRDLTQKEKVDISKATADLYEITKKDKKEKQNALTYDKTPITDELRRKGINLGGQYTPEANIAKDSNNRLKSMEKSLESIDEKTELQFDNTEMRFPA